MEEWVKLHGVSRSLVYDKNYGLSLVNNRKWILARISVEQRNKLIEMGVDQVFISPQVARRNVHLMVLYVTNVQIDPMSPNYTEQLYEGYMNMFNVFLLQFFASSVRELQTQETS